MTGHAWLSFYPPEIDWREAIAPRPLFEILDDAAANFPDNPAIDFFGKKTSYRELHALASRAAEGFRRLGAGRGTKIGLFLPNCPASVIAYYGALYCGATVVNFSPLYAQPELEHQLADSDTEIMVTLDLKALLPKILPLLGKGKLRKTVVVPFTGFLAFPKNILFRLLRGGQIASASCGEVVLSWDDLLENPGIREVPAIDPEKDIAVLQYTGGTTGTPKGAMLSHANLHANAVQCARWFPDAGAGKERMLGILPLFHVFAMTTVMNFSILKGAEMILHPRFNLYKALKDIHRKRPTLMPGVPTMYAAINQAKNLRRYDLSSLKACISGGAPLPLEVKEKFEDLTGCTLVEGYGLTETSPVVCANPLSGVNKAGTIGLPLPRTEVAIEDMEKRGTFLGTGEKGELCVKGPQVMLGYWKRPDETAKVLPSDGWLRTGDVAVIEADGYVRIADRLKDVIIAGGFNIYPRHVEEAIYQHPSVLEAAVVGVPDEYRGQAVKAFVALKPGHALTASELQDFLRGLIGSYEIPATIEFLDSLPKTMIGKVDKKALK